MARMKILKGFHYSHDGVTHRSLVEGAVEDIRDDLVAGLKKEGFVEKPGKSAAPVDPPAAASDPAPADPASTEIKPIEERPT